MAPIRPRPSPVLALVTLLAGCGLLVGGCGEDVAPAPNPDLTTVAATPDMAVEVVEDMTQPMAADDLSVVVPPETPDDLAVPPSPCANTPASCGLASCVNCASSSAGGACVQGTCGCNGPLDCPTGTACDPSTHVCGTGCAGGLICNGGCCDGTSCAGGGDVPECGSTGVACDDCSGSTAGPLCVGHCGCSSAADCPAGQACLGNVCGYTCDDSHPCNSQCCNGGSCADTCELSNNGHVCLALTQPSCGCNTVADCPLNSACNTNTHQCTSSCGVTGTTACNGGCCSGGQCKGAAQMGQAICGDNGGDCKSCSANSLGTTCELTATGGFCGCTGNGECPANSCDVPNKQCIVSCSGGNSACNGIGCCQSATTCQSGLNDSVCGPKGSACTSCLADDTDGHKCLPNPDVGTGGGVCGCNGPGDCPSGKGCDLTTHKCTTACTSSQPCNGCCSSGADGGVCQPGTSPGACGNPDVASGICGLCASSTSGHACVATTLGGHCGCNNNSGDCTVGRACDKTGKLCTTRCGLFNETGCNGGCCGSGLCQTGLSTRACGAQDGGICETCSGGTPTCHFGACTNDCNILLAKNTGQVGTCSSGFCCDPSKKKCTDGTVDTTCGSSGTCKDCVVDVDAGAVGDKCVTNPDAGVSACGCTAGADCPAHEACHSALLPLPQCSASCGTGFSTCNLGCCDNAKQTCVPGASKTLCGAAGGACLDCTCSVRGPACAPTAGGGVCGCDKDNTCTSQSTCGYAFDRTTCDPEGAICCIPKGGGCGRSVTGAGSCCKGTICKVATGGGTTCQ